MKRKMWLISAIAIIILCAGGLWFWFQRSSSEKGVPVPEQSQTPAQHPDIHTEKDNKTETADQPAQLQKRQMRLSPEPIQFRGSDPINPEDNTMSIKKKNRDIDIAHNVVVRPGEGVVIKRSNDAETIKIKRDKEYRNEYQVLFEKRY